MIVVQVDSLPDSNAPPFGEQIRQWIADAELYKQHSEGGMIRLESLIELKFINSSSSSSSSC